jgi:hypothetical protein
MAILLDESILAREVTSTPLRSEETGKIRFGVAGSIDGSRLDTESVEQPTSERPRVTNVELVANAYITLGSLMPPDDES